MVPHFLAAPHIVVETDLVLTVASRIAASFATVLPLRVLEPPFAIPAVRGTMLWHDRHEGDPAHAWLRRRIEQIAAEELAPRPWRTRGGGLRARQRRPPPRRVSP